MSENTTERQSALEQLSTHPGWRIFVLHVIDEWGATGQTYQAELDKALGITDNHAAASQARQVRSGQKAILKLLDWPVQEVQRLTRISEKPESNVVSSGRGGYQ